MCLVRCSYVLQVTLDVVTMHQSLYYRLAIKKALAKAFRDKGVPADRSAGSRDADHGPSLGPDSDIKVPGYSDGFVQGMRGAPFAYPRMKGEDGEVEVCDVSNERSECTSQPRNFT